MYTQISPRRFRTSKLELIGSKLRFYPHVHVKFTVHDVHLSYYFIPVHQSEDTIDWCDFSYVSYIGYVVLTTKGKKVNMHCQINNKRRDTEEFSVVLMNGSL